MDREEIMLRQLKGQHLLQPVEGLQAAGDICGFQAQYVSNALHALRLRRDRKSTRLNSSHS